MASVHSIAISVFAWSLTGCVAGQQLALDYVPPERLESIDVEVVVAVDDRRPYVVDGKKPPSYVGQYRAGFGNPWDVNVTGEVPLSQVVEKDLRQELEALGFGLGDATAERTLRVVIREWNMDTYQNGRFWYELDVGVFDRDGGLLAQNQIEATKYVKGTFWSGGKGGAERVMPEFYRELIESVVRNNDEVRSALTD